MERPTSVGIKIPTSHSFRVGWDATLIRVNRTVSQNKCGNFAIGCSGNDPRVNNFKQMLFMFGPNLTFV